MDIETLKTAAEVSAVATENVSLAKAIIIGFGVMGPAIGLGIMFSKGLEGISRNPQATGKISTWLYNRSRNDRASRSCSNRSILPYIIRK